MLVSLRAWLIQTSSYCFAMPVTVVHDVVLRAVAQVDGTTEKTCKEGKVTMRRRYDSKTRM